jgi:hypothetical protein
MRTWLLALAPLVTSGCLEKEATDPSMIVRAESPPQSAPLRGGGSRAVRCGCDADGGLHVRAPAGSRVFVPDDASLGAEAEIIVPEEARPAPLRRVRSLGFIGDGKLTESRSRGGPWNAPDAVLPPHQHVQPYYGPTGYGYHPSYRAHAYRVWR